MEIVYLVFLVFVALCVTVFLILLFLFTEIIKSKIFSGYPYLSEAKKEKTRAIKIAILKFIFGMFVEGCFYVFLIYQSWYRHEFDLDQWLQIDDLNQTYLYLILLFLIFLRNVLPSFSILRSAYLRHFSKQAEQGELDSYMSTLLPIEGRVSRLNNQKVSLRTSTLSNSSQGKQREANFAQTLSSLDKLLADFSKLTFDAFQVDMVAFFYPAQSLDS